MLFESLVAVAALNLSRVVIPFIKGNIKIIKNDVLIGGVALPQFDKRGDFSSNYKSLANSYLDKLQEAHVLGLTGYIKESCGSDTEQFCKNGVLNASLYAAICKTLSDINQFDRINIIDGFTVLNEKKHSIVYYISQNGSNKFYIILTGDNIGYVHIGGFDTPDAYLPQFMIFDDDLNSIKYLIDTIVTYKVMKMLECNKEKKEKFIKKCKDLTGSLVDFHELYETFGKDILYHLQSQHPYASVRFERYSYFHDKYEVVHVTNLENLMGYIDIEKCDDDIAMHKPIVMSGSEKSCFCYEFRKTNMTGFASHTWLHKKTVKVIIQL